MEIPRGDQRFLASTRGQVATLLRRGPRTVDELAATLNLTDNAIRSHLAALERDGLVQQGALRRGTGRPSYTYELTPAADRLFPKAYGVLLAQLLDVLTERLPRDDVAAALREVGHRLASGQAPTDADLAARVEQAVLVLDELGGLAEAEETAEGFVIRGCSCPLAAAVESSPESCLLAEALLADLIGVPVHQTCEHGSPPHCRFEVLAASSAGSPEREVTPM